MKLCPGLSSTVKALSTGNLLHTISGTSPALLRRLSTARVGPKRLIARSNHRTGILNQWFVSIAVVLAESALLPRHDKNRL